MERLLLPPLDRDDDVFLGPSLESTEIKYRQRVVADRSPFFRFLNFCFALLYLGAALAILLLFFVDHIGRFKYDIYTAFPTIHGDGKFSFSDFDVIWRLPINILSSVYLALGGIYHLMVALFIRKRYENLLARNQNPFRWIELSISLPIMHVQLAVLAGIGDIHSLLALFCLAHSAMVMILIFEVINGGRRNRGIKVNWAPLALAIVPQLFTWGIVFLNFGHSASHGGRPSLIWSILVLAFFMETVFFCNSLLQWKWYSDFLKGEVAWILVSFVYKQLLAWLTFGSKSK